MQTTSWTNVAIFLAGGTIAAIHIGKVPTALAIIQLEFEMNLILAGLFFSIFSLIGVFLGVSAGSIFTKVASSKIIFSAFAILAICDVAGARTDDLFVLFLGRIFEGLCFVAIAVTFPTYITFVTNARDRPLALSIWSLFIPIGFAISLTTSSVLLSNGIWRDMWTFCAILSCLYLVFSLCTRRVLGVIADVGRLGAIRRGESSQRGMSDEARNNLFTWDHAPKTRR